MSADPMHAADAAGTPAASERHCNNSRVTWFGFAIADSMFHGSVCLQRSVLLPDEARAILRTAQTAGQLRICLNRSHEATVAAMRNRFGIDVLIKDAPPARARVKPGECLIVMSVRGLPRLESPRRDYTATEIAGAEFVFARYLVEGLGSGLS